MSESKKTDRAKVLRKLRRLRKTWAEHEGADTPYGHMLLGPNENGAPVKKTKNKNR